MKNKNIPWIGGLKGLAALVVFVHHFALFFYPAFINGNSASVKTSGNLELLIAKTPFNIFAWGGNAAVCIFFVLSGFLIAYNYFGKNKKSIKAINVVRRYFKLMFPILISSIIIFVVLKTQIFRTQRLIDLYAKIGLKNNYEGYNQTFFAVIWDSVLNLFRTGSFVINPPMWTMKVELICSVASMLFLSVFGKSNKRYLVYLITGIIMINSYFTCFIIGIALCDVWLNKKEFLEKINKIDIKFIIFAISIFLLSVTYVSQNGMLYKLLYNLFSGIDYEEFYHSLGAGLFVLLVLLSKNINKLFSSKLFSFIGDVSLEIYLFHWMIINTVSMFLVAILVKFIPYYLACLSSFVISFVIIMIISKYFKKYINRITNYSTNKIIGIFDK